MKFTQKQVVIVIAGIVLLIVIGVVLFLNLRPHANSGPVVKLSVWGVEGKDAMGALFAQYPYATVTYTQIDPANYETELLGALASGKGPDVFEINNRSLPRWKNVLAAMPASYAAQFSSQQLAATFPDVVQQDFVSAGALYALPLSIDTMVTLYNKDLFNAAGVVFPPKTWNELQADVTKLRTMNAQGQITQAAAAIGGSEISIANASDLIFLLMLQNGTKMTTVDNSSAQFANSASGPGIAAFNFYLQFASAASPYYTWNDGMGSAVDSFTSGKTAILFGYASDLKTIKQKAPFLNLGIAPIPQAMGATIPVTYPKYYGFAAAKVGQTAYAWNFILYMMTNPGVEKSYVTSIGLPPAQRTEIETDLTDPMLSVFATQALTARSWYEPDDQKIDAATNSAIQNVLNGVSDSWQALQILQGTVSSLIVGQ
jgi:multiple sugar transport system substrate-binding protein